MRNRFMSVLCGGFSLCICLSPFSVCLLQICSPHGGAVGCELKDPSCSWNHMNCLAFELLWGSSLLAFLSVGSSSSSGQYRCLCSKILSVV